jgi:hypothetical protein
MWSWELKAAVARERENDLRRAAEVRRALAARDEEELARLPLDDDEVYPDEPDEPTRSPWWSSSLRK